MRFKRFVVALSVLATLCAMGFIASPAAACSSSPRTTTDNYVTHYSNGWIRPKSSASPVTWDWFSATIDTQQPYVFPESVNKQYEFVYNWIMLVSDTNTGDGNFEFAQIGPAVLNDGNRYDFVTCHPSANTYTFGFNPGRPAGSAHNYEVLDTASNGVDLLADGVTVNSCGNVLFNEGWANTDTETLTRVSQFGGSVSNHIVYDNMHVRNGGVTVNLMTNGEATASSASGGVTWDKITRNLTTDDEMETWDADCS
jgi:hypothetical protein